MDDTSVHIWSRGLGYGVVIWAIVFFVMLFSFSTDIYDSAGVKIAIAISGGVVAYLFGLATKPIDLESAFLYGIIWAIIGIVLDLTITRMFYPVFYSWSYWFCHAFIILAPLFTIKRHYQNQPKFA